jgi:3-methyl-2-oxobutanoate hydroxymethyltransferase
MNVIELIDRKRKGEKISMSTCYTNWEARILNQTDVDSLLVGDSLAMVVYGHPTTLPATTEMMVRHTEAVVKGAPKKFVVADMPFLSFRKGIAIAMDCVEDLMKVGAHAVKLEGVDGHEDVVKNIVQSGVPVMGHIGLTPQSFHGLGGFKVQGQTSEQKKILMGQAKKLEQCGVFSIVLECVPTELAADITKSISIPTIGIGAGAVTDGQVLVLHDLLGMNTSFKPRFVRHFMNGEATLIQALTSFHNAVRSGEFPLPEESYK